MSQDSVKIFFVRLQIGVKKRIAAVFPAVLIVGLLVADRFGPAGGRKDL